MHAIDILQTNLIKTELLDEGGPDFQVGPSTVKELESLQEGPLVLAHEVASPCTRRARLASDRVHQDGLRCLKCLIDEIKDGLGSFIAGVAQVKEDLVVLI